MREGELFGLGWADVNLAAGSLHLVKQLKTRSSRRQVLLVSVAVDALRRHLARQREERLLLGLEWDDHGLAFSNTVGKPLHPSNFLQRSFYPLQARAGLPWPWHPPQGRERDARPQPDRHHPGPILPRHGYHAAGGDTGPRRTVWQSSWQSGRSDRTVEPKLTPL